MARLHIYVICAALLAAGSASAREPAPLRLMTYNIRLDLASDGPNAWPHRRQWVVSQVDWLRPDLFGLQEVTPRQKADFARDLPNYRFIGGGRDDGREQGEASPLAFDPDRFELLDSGMFWLSPTPDAPSKGWDAAYNRVTTWARLRVRDTDRKVLAINTHWDHIGVTAREQAAKQTARWIMANAQRCESVIYMGDFNTGLASEPLRHLTSGPLSLRDSRGVSRDPAVGPAGTFNGFKLDPPKPEAIDHILLGPGVEVQRYLVLTQVIDGRWPSDHFPVIVDVTLPRCR